MTLDAGRAVHQSGKSPRLLLSVPTGHNVANLLRGGVLDELLTQAPGVDVAIVSPFAADAKFRDEFSRPGVSFEGLPSYKPTPAERIVESILCERFLRESRLTAVRLQRDRARLLEGWRGRRTAALAKSALCHLPIPRRVWFRVARSIARPRGHAELFERHRPALLVTSTSGFFETEMPLVWEAARRGVPHAVVDLGWDNLSSKYHTIRPADRVTVWNDQMREEAVRYHGFRRDRVIVTGAVQFDQYADRGRVPSRREFLLRIGAPDSAKVVTLATPGQAVYRYSGFVVEHLARALQAGELGAGVHVLVRVHPRDRVDAYARFQDLPSVTIEKPIARLNASPKVSPFDDVAPTTDDRRHLAATLAHSDVLVNLASTTTLEAFLFDTPVVNVGFDGDDDLPLPLSVRRYYRYEHYQPVLRAGAVTIAGDPAELIHAVRTYLAHPERDRDARRAVVAQLCGAVDGRAAVRVAQTIVEMLPRSGVARPEQVLR